MSDLPPDANPEPEEFDPADLELDDGEEIEPEPEEEDEEPEPEPEEAEGEGEGTERDRAAPGPRQGRKTQTQRRLERAERELRELRQQQQNFHPQPAAPDPAALARAEQEKWDRRALMAPAEIAREVQQESEQRMLQYLQVQNFQTQDRIDKQAYDAEARTSRVHRQYQDRVETVLANERARGNIAANREAILAYLVGQDTIRRGNSAAPRQRQQAARRVAGQQTRPASPRGDGAVSRRPAADSYEAAVARLAGKPLW